MPHVEGHKAAPRAAARTPQEIAQDKLDAANAKLAKLDKRIERLEDELEAARAERAPLVTDRDYRADHWALKGAQVAPPTATGSTTPTGETMVNDLDALEPESDGK